MLKWVVALSGMVALTAGCAANPVAQDQVDAADVAVDGSDNIPLNGISLTADGPPPVPVPALIPPTGLANRLPEVSITRNDPFAGLEAQPIVVPSTTAAAVIETVPPIPVPVFPGGPMPPVPVPAQVTAAPLPLLQPAPLMPGAALPSTAVPSTFPAAAPAPGSLANAIEVSGVIQAGSRVNAIVRVPEEGTSRYVSVGDRLANGQILVKRIEVRPGEDPLVILEQDGMEITRWVGSSTL